MLAVEDQLKVSELYLFLRTRTSVFVSFVHFTHFLKGIELRLDNYNFRKKTIRQKISHLEQFHVFGFPFSVQKFVIVRVDGSFNTI